MLALNYHRRSRRGDTIVEVMIVLAVLGMAISISYATANRSLLNARQAQESSEATELVQTQVEDLRILAPNTGDDVSNNNIFTKTVAYCVHNPTPTPPTKPITPYDHTDAASCSFGTNNLYTVLVYNCDALASDLAGICKDLNGPGLGTAANTSVVQASWPDVLGDGNDKVTLTYRVHQ